MFITFPLNLSINFTLPSSLPFPPLPLPPSPAHHHSPSISPTQPHLVSHFTLQSRPPTSIDSHESTAPYDEMSNSRVQPPSHLAQAKVGDEKEFQAETASTPKVSRNAYMSALEYEVSKARVCSFEGA